MLKQELLDLLPSHLCQIACNTFANGIRCYSNPDLGLNSAEQSPTALSLTPIELL